MDIKINSKRIKNLLSYDWIKIILSIIAGIIVWSLLFTTLGTRITVGQEFYFHTYDNVFTAGSVERNQEVLDNIKKKGYFSYDLLKLSTSNIVSAGQYSASYMLSLKRSTNEGDVMIISDERAEAKTEKAEQADIISLVNSYYFYDIETLLKSAKDYCINNDFVVEKLDGSWAINEEAIKDYFLNTRIVGKGKGNYRKTYRTAQQKAMGVQNEYNRIKLLYENYLYVSTAIEKAIKADNDFLWYGELYTYDSLGKKVEDLTEIKPFGIDLYKLNQPFLEDSTVPKVEDTWFTYADGVPTAEGLVACVFDFHSEQEDLQYETLGFLRYLIETYSRYNVNV